MNFTTKIPISKSQKPIDYSSKIMSIGSCFAENMGEKFQYFKFNTTVNPFGIIFNPVSIEKLILRVVNQEKFTEKDVFFHNEMWHCFEVHSELSNPNKEEFLENLNTILESTNQQITKSTHLIFTYGTSWVYRNKLSNEIVANCHKVPQNQFDKEILSVETIESSIKNTVELIQKVNPKCNFIFTISPVRHIKDGFFENNVSKGNLFLALNNILKTEYCKLKTEYFPSYEILIDELRDYRFYANDMLHPSQVAIDYIWINFFENYIDEKEFATMNQVCEIQRALKHRPFNPNSESHLQFLKNIQQKIDKLAENFAHIKF